MISAVTGGIATLLAMSVRPRRCPVELRVAGVEPSSMIYYGGRQAMLVTLSASNSDSVDVTYEIPTFEAKVGGLWIVHIHPFGEQQVGGVSRMSAGAKREEMLVMPGGTEACRVRLRYFSDTWKSRFIVSIRPTGRKWVAKSPWLRELVWPDPFESMRVQPWKSNTVEIMIPQSDRKPRALMPSAHNQIGPANGSQPSRSE
jgi:hypothetical protein